MDGCFSNSSMREPKKELTHAELKQSQAQRWASLQVAHGARFDKLFASETELAQALVRKRQIATLYSTLSLAVLAAVLLSPLGARELYQRTPISIGLLAACMVANLVWILQMGRLGRAWLYQRDLKKLGQSSR